MVEFRRPMQVYLGGEDITDLVTEVRYESETDDMAVDSLGTPLRMNGRPELHIELNEERIREFGLRLIGEARTELCYDARDIPLLREEEIRAAREESIRRGDRRRAFLSPGGGTIPEGISAEMARRINWSPSNAGADNMIRTMMDGAPMRGNRYDCGVRGCELCERFNEMRENGQRATYALLDEAVEYAGATRAGGRHTFVQDPQEEPARLCSECGMWPDHHNHYGGRCVCADCDPEGESGARFDMYSENYGRYDGGTDAARWSAERAER